jgi:RND family efflux transporter MFP subunit
MARRKLTELARYLHRITVSSNGNGLTDAELVERYVCYRDEAAFELLLWRHGTLVHNVCRRILLREEDAEDAFQATFLTFVRKAHAIGRRASVASWLYKVAYRIALEARARRQKIAGRERHGEESLAVQPSIDPAWDELRSVLDEELSRLPERLRRPIILCYLEGKTNEEAARELGCPTGTVFSRLSRGRDMLRNRLVRRGVTLSTATLMTVLTERAAEAVPAATLVQTTLRAALHFADGGAVGGSVSTQATALAEGVLRTMFVTKIKLAALVVLCVGLLATGGVLTRDALNAAPQPEAQKKAPTEIARKDEDKKATVYVVHPTPGGLERIARLPGHVRAWAQQQVFAAIPGYLKEQLVDIGSVVKKGDVLAAIDAPLVQVETKQAEAAVQFARGQVLEARAGVNTAEAELKAALDRIKYCEAKVKSDRAYLNFRKTQTKRFEDLLSQKSIDARLVDEQQERREAAQEAVNASEEALASARSDVTVKRSKVESAKAALATPEAKLVMARLDLEKAQIRFALTRIVSSFDGVVTQRNFDVGDFIAAGDQGGRRPLMTVLRTDVVRVVVEVSESDVSLTRPGIPVDLHTGVLPGQTFSGCKVSRIGFALDERTATMPVEIDVPNPKGLLRPGMFMSATLHLAKGAPNAFTIPSFCLAGESRAPGAGLIYVVRDGEAHRTLVRLGQAIGDKVEVLSGLQTTDRIVSDPKGLSGDVVPVEIKKTP